MALSPWSARTRLVRLALGAVLCAACVSCTDPRPRGAPAPVATSQAPTAAASRPPTDPPSPDATSPASPPPFRDVVLVWPRGGGVERLADLLSEDSARTAVVRVGAMDVASGVAGYPSVPLEVLVAEPAGYADLAGRTSLAEDMTGGLVLSRTTAQARGLQAGASVPLADGSRRTVTAVVADADIGGYEAATSTRLLPGATASYLLVRPRNGEEALRQRVESALGGRDARVRRQGEVPFLRAGDVVLPQGAVRARFGEFALRRTAGGFRQDPAFAERFITTRTVPLLGQVRCHRAMLDDLGAALAALEAAGLGGLVDAAEYGGCFAARPTRGSTSLSRHSWGLAVDINVTSNPLGAVPTQDARVVAAFEQHGFVWGGRFLRPDGHHFEYVGSGA